MSLFGIFLGLALLVLFAFKGKSLLWAAPLCAFVVALTGGLEPLSAYTESYMSGFVGFVKDWFPVFLLSAIFGKVMEVTGGAQSITHFVVRRLGSQRAIFVSILSAAIMAYGGISGFVISLGIAFAQYDSIIPILQVIGVFAVGQFLEGNFLTPKLVGDSIGLHPVWIMFALLAGGVLLGFLGLMIAVPTAGILGVLIRHAIDNYKHSNLYLAK